ncbi:hypothetical protein M2145_002368, partial [Lachnospiraceae bacterium PF1-21]
RKIAGWGRVLSVAGKGEKLQKSCLMEKTVV